MSEHMNRPDSCGCCEGVENETPITIDNAPGLSGVAFRTGTHSRFKASMLSSLSARSNLATLTSRSDDDPTIVLVDAWAAVLDVLTFYQERIANEGFLGTATERRSVLELARSIGYELGPGVAAGTYLAFTLETAEGSPGEINIPAGTKAQSIPGQDESPQTFETSEDSTARPAWNELKPRLTEPQTITQDSKEIYLAGTDNNVGPGDMFLLVWNDTGSVCVKRVESTETDDDNGRTLIELSDVTTVETGTGSGGTVPPAGVQADLSASPVFNKENVLSLGTLLTEIQLQALVAEYGWEMDKVVELLNSIPETSGEVGVFVFRDRVGFLGHNAPKFDTLPTSIGTQTISWGADWDNTGWSIWNDPLETATRYSVNHDADVFLERVVSGISKETWAVFRKANGSATVFRIAGVTEASVVGFGMSTKGTGLILEDQYGQVLASKDDLLLVRKTSAFVRSEELELTEQPIETDVAAGSTAIELDVMVDGLTVDKAVALTGTQSDGEGVTQSEVLLIKEITHESGHTTLEFHTALQYSYLRSTVRINANVAPATHGETRAEVIGSGDGSQSFQKFTLKQTPLTYVSAPTPSGNETTLEIRVNNVQWNEVPSLYQEGAAKKVFTTRRADDGTVTVRFGDGITGARLPTGSENVMASYRIGTGISGLLDAEQISLLMSRPLGVKSVLNPVAPSGAEDPEELDDARTNAPFTVLTLDRIVSLQDYEDFARAFAGIGKASATLLWSGEKRIVHLTVLGTDGAEVGETSDLFRNLVNGIEAARHSEHPVFVAAGNLKYFSVEAKVLVDDSFVAPDVLQEVSDALEAAFEFSKRSFGQAVTESEVIAVMQGVAGVVAVDLDFLYPSASESPDLNARLEAKGAASEDGGFTPAELWVISPTGIVLSEMTS